MIARLVSLAVALCAGLSAQSSGPWYVAPPNGNPAGSTSNTGLSASSPWTLAHALTHITAGTSVSSPNYVNLAAGTYALNGTMVFNVANIAWQGPYATPAVSSPPTVIFESSNAKITDANSWTAVGNHCVETSYTLATGNSVTDQLYGRWLINGPHWALAPYSDTDLNIGARHP